MDPIEPAVLDNYLLRLERAIEEAEHKPAEWALTQQSMGGICTLTKTPITPFSPFGPPEERWAGFEFKRDARLAMEAVRALPELMDRARQANAQAQALREIIEMNRQHAEDQYGDAEMAERWACVKVAREALGDRSGGAAVAPDAG